MIKEIKNQVGNNKVICGLSGGVDSSVVAQLLSKAIGKNLTCIFVNNGLLRKNEEIWKKQLNGKKIVEEEILKLMIKYPKLIERPMVINGNKGIIARPLENLMDFIDKY